MGTRRRPGIEGVDDVARSENYASLTMVIGAPCFRHSRRFALA